MITRCPYSDCRHEWQHVQLAQIETMSSNGLVRGYCEKCSRPATLRPLEVWEQIERKLAYLTSKNARQSISHELRDSGLGQASCILGEENIKTKISPIVSEKPILHAVLEDIRSLHNVGSIFRSGDAFGFQQLHLCGITGTPDRKEVRKTSLTAESNVDWRYYMSAMDALAVLRESKAYVIALERCNGSVAIGEIDWQSFIGCGLVVLVVGNEVSGVSEEILASADLKCHIPMRGIKESLNVSVAFGVAAYSIASVFDRIALL